MKKRIFCAAGALFLVLTAGMGFNGQEVCVDAAEPAVSNAPIIEPLPEIPDADYADVCIQALEQCSKVAPNTVDKEYLALDFDGKQVWADEDKERVEDYLLQKGYIVKTAEIERLERQGFVRRDDQNNWILLDAAMVRFYINGLIEPGKLYVTCSVKDNFYAECSGMLIYTEEEGRWHCRENRMEWSGDERYFPEKLLGDTDGDARISLSDACRILQTVLKIVPEQEQQRMDFDLNDDGNLTLEDAAIALGQALKIEAPVYAVPLSKDRIYAEVVDVPADDVLVTGAGAETASYLQGLGLKKAAECISQLGETELKNRQILVAVSSTNVCDKAQIESHPYLKTGSGCLHNHFVEKIAAQDEKRASYVQMFLVEAGYQVKTQKITKETQ